MTECTSIVNSFNLCVDDNLLKNNKNNNNYHVHISDNNNNNNNNNICNDAKSEIAITNQGTKQCTKCEKILPLFKFTRRKGRKNEYQRTCRKCGELFGKSTNLIIQSKKDLQVIGK